MHVVFYTDLRCPFCYVQSQRLARRPEGVAVEPRPVRSGRDLPVPSRALSDAEKDNLVAYRARIAGLSDIDVPSPSTWPNTRAASLAVAAAARTAPDQALDLLNRLFHAMWVEGRDVADPLVIRESVRLAGYRTLVPDRQDERSLELHDRAFEAHSADWRTPTLVSSNGASLVGLGSARQLEAFLRSGRIGYADDEVCEVEPRR